MQVLTVPPPPPPHADCTFRVPQHPPIYEPLQHPAFPSSPNRPFFSLALVRFPKPARRVLFPKGPTLGRQRMKTEQGKRLQLSRLLWRGEVGGGGGF